MGADRGAARGPRGSSLATPPVTLHGPDPLSDDAFRAAPGAVETPLDIRYAWDPGQAVGAFLDGLSEGRILATTCSSCGRTLVPPRAFCERCFRPTDGWVELPSTGTVETFSICHVAWDMRSLEEPELPAVIRIDGASDGGFLHRLGEIDPMAIRIGTEVEAVWRPIDERSGSILDIAYFRPRHPGQVMAP
ncbi:MAG TPA: Zn-ribbon domain-containing OB-fold protein [Actinomycetota bacterium]